MSASKSQAEWYARLTPEQKAARQARQRALRAADPNYREKQRAYQRARQAADPSFQKERSRKYRKANPWPARRCMWRKQGINPVVAEAALRAHDGRCDLCGATEPRGVGGWHVDHDHGSGKVRGILCCSCNLGVGAVDRVGMARVEQYLNRNH